MRERVSAAVLAVDPLAPVHAAARADRILEGRFDLLGYCDLRFGLGSGDSPDWHLDPVHARRTPRRFWASVPFLDPACGDHKVIWELNRHQHLLTLGRAYWLTGNDAYRRLAIAHIVDWIAQNPPLIGVNWASMLELGFRSLSWLWAMHFFALDTPDADDTPWLVDLVLALDRQLRHIEQNLSYYFSPNTHLLGEALAMYVTGRTLTWLARADGYASTGRAVLVQEIDRQVARDGGHVERSTHYQRYTLDFYALALATATITADPVASAFREAVARLASASRLLADDTGRMPHIGDDDGGQLLPITGRSPDDVRGSLAIASALTGDSSPRTPPEEAVWMLSHQALREPCTHAGGSTARSPHGSAVLEQTGYCVSRGPDGTHLVFDAGAHGFANGGHAHADALSLTLSVRGVPLLIDPGTGSYTADPALRDRLRSSASHNTLTLDRRSQSVPSGAFHWAHTAQGRLMRWRAEDSFDYMQAEHDGYAPVMHRRHVLIMHGDMLVVADQVDGTGEHHIEANWHFAPHWHLRLAQQRVELLGSAPLSWATSSGEVSLTRSVNGDAGGCWSPVYGRIEPTCSLRVSHRAALPHWLVTVVALSDDDVVAVSPVESDGLGESGGMAMRIVRRQGVDLFVVSSSGDESGRLAPRWNAAGITSDAHMLCARISGRGVRTAVVDGIASALTEVG